MSHRKEKRLRRASRAALMTVVSLDVLAMALPAGAQEATTAPRAQGAKSDDSTIQEVVVSSYRASLESAVNRKRESLQPIESIVAEDIGKMPDQNVAESLQRLPGIQINRAGGKGTQVLIDGLGNNLITLNGEVFLTGRESYTSGEASGGGAGGNVQYASLEGIPSEEIGGIDVIKNPSASDREGGLGGTINLLTRSALAQQDGLNLAANVRGTKASDADGGVTPVATLVGGYKFSDNFAITASLSYDDQKTRDKQFQDQNRNQWLITDAAQVGSYVGSPSASTLSTMPGGQLYIIPQLAYLSDILQEVKTKGGALGAEWKWSDSISSSLNYFYVKEEDESTTYSNKVWFNGQGSAPGSLHPGIDPSQPFTIDSNGVVQSATFMANGAETATLYQNQDAQSNTVHFTTRFTGDGPLTGDFGLFWAKATRSCRPRKPTSSMGCTTGPRRRARGPRPQRLPVVTTVAQAATTATTDTASPGTTAAPPVFLRSAIRTHSASRTSCRTRPIPRSSPTGPGRTRSTKRTRRSAPTCSSRPARA
jgi:TonB-dependent receptor